MVIDRTCDQILVAFAEQLDAPFREVGKQYARHLNGFAEEWIKLPATTFKATCGRGGNFVRKNAVVAAWPRDL